MKFLNLLFIGIGSLFIACSPVEEDVGLEPLRSDLELRTVPEGDSDRYFYLVIQTEEVYSCSNYPLVTTTNVEDGQLEVTVEGVGEVTTCATAFGPATANLGLDESIERILIRKNWRTDEYQVAPSEDDLELIPLRTSFSNVAD